MNQDIHQQQVLEVCLTLRKIRIEKGLSQQRLSEMASLSRTGLRHIESGEISPTLYSLLKISDALEVDFTKLVLFAKEKCDSKKQQATF